jgi:hypothetical protein
MKRNRSNKYMNAVPPYKLETARDLVREVRQAHPELVDESL